MSCKLKEFNREKGWHLLICIYLTTIFYWVILNLQQCLLETEKGHVENSSTVIGLTWFIPGIALRNYHYLLGKANFWPLYELVCNLRLCGFLLLCYFKPMFILYFLKRKWSESELNDSELGFENTTFTLRILELVQRVLTKAIT